MEEVRQSNVHQLYLTEEIAVLRAAARCTCLKTCPSTDTDPLSYDEKPGIQAIENTAPDLPPVPGNRISKAIMEKNKVSVEVLRAVDHDIAYGVWPDISKKVMAADILVLTSSIWLGEKTSACAKVIERLYGNSHLLNEAGQYAYYGRVGGCLITGNEDGANHCAMNILCSLQHLGYVIPPQADAGWLGEAGPGPSYLDPGSGGPEYEARSCARVRAFRVGQSAGRGLKAGQRAFEA